jgi:hypothetical protein
VSFVPLLPSLAAVATVVLAIVGVRSWLDGRRKAEDERRRDAEQKAKERAAPYEQLRQDLYTLNAEYKALLVQRYSEFVEYLSALQNVELLLSLQRTEQLSELERKKYASELERNERFRWRDRSSTYYRLMQKVNESIAQYEALGMGVDEWHELNTYLYEIKGSLCYFLDDFIVMKRELSIFTNRYELQSHFMAATKKLKCLASDTRGPIATPMD